MKKLLTWICTFCMCGIVALPGNAAECSIVSNRDALDWTLGIIGGGIGWATGGAIGASLAPFGLIGRGGIDPVVGTLRINGTILASSVGGAVAGASVASKIYGKEDYLCFDEKGKKCLQCDMHQVGRTYECDDDKVVIAPGFVKKCHTRLVGKDEWENYNGIGICKGSKIQGIPKGGKVALDIRSSFLKDFTSDGIYGVYVVSSKSACFMVDCADGWEYDSANKVCKEKSTPTPTPTPKKTCRQERTEKRMSDKAIACCDTGSLADWNGTDCVCRDKTTEFKIVNGVGKCVPKQTNPIVGPGDNHTPEPKKCDDPVNMDANCDCKPQYTYNYNGRCKCNDDNARLVDGACNCKHIDGAEFKNGECVCKNKDKEISGGKCVWNAAHLAKLKAEIDSKYSKVKELTDSFKKNVWRDAEGNFNTARLASDSIAGVVLGTVGGVVTAHVVKKAQLKQGFEDIQCHIGGQSVAGYGDGFVVGR